MIISYGFSVQGLSHRKKDIPCQDANYIKHFGNGWALAAIADGLGSSAYADVAAMLAVSVFDNVDESILPDIWDGGLAKSILRGCFERAHEAIISESKLHGREISDYYTTLTAVLYDGKNLAYGHCGDGGVIGLCDDGKYHIVTQVQKGDEWSIVTPLNSGAEYWLFDQSPDSFCGVMLLTDGLLDVAAPSLLRGDEISGGVYIRFVRQFMEHSVLGITPESASQKKQGAMEFIDKGLPPNVTDDKTLVCLIRSGFTPPTVGAGYYAEPDWEELRAERDKRLYDGGR